MGGTGVRAYDGHPSLLGPNQRGSAGGGEQKGGIRRSKRAVSAGARGQICRPGDGPSVVLRVAASKTKTSRPTCHATRTHPKRIHLWRQSEAARTPFHRRGPLPPNINPAFATEKEAKTASWSSARATTPNRRGSRSLGGPGAKPLAANRGGR